MRVGAIPFHGELKGIIDGENRCPTKLSPRLAAIEFKVVGLMQVIGFVDNKLASLPVGDNPLHNISDRYGIIVTGTEIPALGKCIAISPKPLA